MVATSYLYWKRKEEKKYRLLGIGFKDDNFAINEAANMLRRGFDVKIKKNNKYYFDSKFM